VGRKGSASPQGPGALPPPTTRQELRFVPHSQAALQALENPECRRGPGVWANWSQGRWQARQLQVAVVVAVVVMVVLLLEPYHL
jgi:hypothetical protein